MATIVDISGMPFDAKLENGVYDRVVYSADIARYFNLQTRDGILIEQGKVLTDEFECSRSATALGVDIQPGNMMIKGYLGWFDEQTTVTTTANTETYPRIDNVVIERNIDVNERKFMLKTVQGTPAESPQPPVVENTDTVQQKVIARLRLEATSSVIGTITDVRTDESLCGVSLMAKEEFEQWKEEYTQELDDYKEQVDRKITQSISLLEDSSIYTLFTGMPSNSGGSSVTLFNSFPTTIESTNGKVSTNFIADLCNNSQSYEGAPYDKEGDIYRQGFVIAKVTDSPYSEDEGCYAIASPIMPITFKHAVIIYRFTFYIQMIFNNNNSFLSGQNFASSNFTFRIFSKNRVIEPDISIDARPGCKANVYSMDTTGLNITSTQSLIITKSDVETSGTGTLNKVNVFTMEQRMLIDTNTTSEKFYTGRRIGQVFNSTSSFSIYIDPFYQVDGGMLTDSDMLNRCYIDNLDIECSMMVKY